MKLLPIFALALLSAGSFLLAAPTQDGPPRERQGEHAQQAGRGEGGEHEETPLEECMEGLEHGVEELAGALATDESLAKGLDEIARLQVLAIRAKGLEPKLVAGIEDELVRRERRREFRLEMQGLVRGLLDVEAALLNTDPEALATTLDALHDVERAGHRQFRPRRERGAGREGGGRREGDGD